MASKTQTPPPAGSPPVKRSRRWAIVLATLIVAGVGAGGWYSYKKRAKATSEQTQARQDERESDEAVPVETVRLAKGGIVRTSTQIGSVHPYEEADLYAKVSGYLANLHVNYGDRVKRGQLLAEIDVPEIVADETKAVADVRQAEAAVAQAAALVEAMKADTEATASALAQATAEIDRYTAMKTFHGKKFERYKRLVLSKAIPQEIADEEEEGYESAKANELASRKAVLKARADLIASEARVQKAESDLDAAKANVGVAEAVRARAEALLGYTKIFSPYDGVVTKRNFFRGAFIRSAAEGNSVPLLTVARTDMVFVVTQVPDRDVPFTDVGDEAEITLDALGTEVFKGKVSRFAETEDPTSRTMHTEIDLPNPDNRLRAGMYGIAKIILDTSAKNSTLPSACLVGESRGDKADVFIIKDHKAKKTQVTVGVDDGLRVEILAGITPQDEVVVNSQSVSDGVPVRRVQTVKASTEAASHGAAGGEG